MQKYNGALVGCNSALIKANYLTISLVNALSPFNIDLNSKKKNDDPRYNVLHKHFSRNTSKSSPEKPNLP